MESLTKPIAIFLITLLLTFSLSGFNLSRTPANPAPNSSLNSPILTTPITPAPISTSVTTPAFQQAQQAFNEGNYKAAIPLWETAIASYKKNNDRLNQAATLNNLALTHQRLNQWPQAQATIKDSLNLITPPNPSSNTKTNPTQITIYAQALDIQANIHFNQGRTQEALNIWQTTEKIYTQLKDDQGQLYSQFNQAQALYAIGFFSKSKTILEKLAQGLKDKSPTIEQVKILLTLSQYYQSIGKLDNSRAAIEKAVETVDSLPDPNQRNQEQPAVYLAHANIKRAIAKRDREIETAADYVVISRYTAYDPTKESYKKAQEALETYRKALNLFKENRNPIDLMPVQIQINIMSLQLELNQESQALTLLSQIDNQLNEIESKAISRGTVSARINIARALQSFARINIPTIEQIINIEAELGDAYKNAKALNDIYSESYALGTLGSFYELEKNWPQAQTQTQKALQIARSVNAPNISYLWQWQLGRIFSAQKQPKAAIEYYKNAVESLKAVRRDLSGTASDTQFSFRDDAEPIYRELVALLLENDKPPAESLLTAIDTINDLQVAELENFFRCGLSQFVTINKVAEQEDRNAVIVYPIILPKGLHVILSLPGQRDQPVTYSTKIKQDILQSKIADFYDTLTAEGPSIEQSEAASQDLYNWLIRPAESKGYIKPNANNTLVFILDSGLRSLSMSALWDSQTDAYLIQKYPIAISPGLDLIGPKRLMPRQLQVLIGGLLNDKDITNLEQDILDLKQIVPQTVDFSNQFYRETLEKQLLQKTFPIVHLWTHAKFSSDPEQTSIQMRDKKTGQVKEIPLSDIQEILRTGKQKSSSALELIIFSACETAKNDRRATLGLAGAAVRSGAGSTLATLWQVDAGTTSELIKLFYKEFKQVIEQRSGTKGERAGTKAAALQAAQIKYLQDPSISSDWKKPYYWSGFVLLGNWL
jgi:CHAT domain-containing protein